MFKTFVVAFCKYMSACVKLLAYVRLINLHYFELKAIQTDTSLLGSLGDWWEIEDILLIILLTWG